MTIRVFVIDRITKENIRHSGFNNRFQKFLEELFRFHGFLHLKTIIPLETRIELIEIFAKPILKRVLGKRLHFMRIKERPFTIRFKPTHKEIWNRNRRENIERF